MASVADGVWDTNRMTLTQENKVLRDKPVTVPPFPPQGPRGLAWDFTQACTVRGWQLSTLAMAQPFR